MIKTKYETNVYGYLISFNHIFVFNGLNIINKLESIYVLSEIFILVKSVFSQEMFNRMVFLLDYSFLIYNNCEYNQLIN
jgi:hypothetical protein